MDSDTQIFWITVMSGISAFILALSRQCYKSKCKKINLCGIIIERDTENEEKFDEQNIQPTTPRDIENQQNQQNQNLKILNPRNNL